MVAEDCCIYNNHPLRRSPNPFSANRIFQDVPEDVTVIVKDQSFLLHKFPLVSRCGKIRKMIAPPPPPPSTAKPKDTTKQHATLNLSDIPGGPQAFQLVAQFCYNIDFDITPSNAASLLCAAHYLDMTEYYKQHNLVARAQDYLNEVVVHSIDKCLQVLSASETLPTDVVREVGVVDACAEALADLVACKERLVDDPKEEEGGVVGEIAAAGCAVEWWAEDLSSLRIDFYRRVILAMLNSGVRATSIVSSLMHYAQVWLNGIEKLQIWNPARTTTSATSCSNTKDHRDQKAIVNTLVTLLPNDDRSQAPKPSSSSSSSIPTSFLFGLLRMSIMADADVASRLELERRIGSRLDTVSLDDLLIPVVARNDKTDDSSGSGGGGGGDSLFDVDTVCRMLVNFLQRVEDEDGEEGGWSECGGGGGMSPSHEAVLKVGHLMDAYLAEIALEAYLSMHKFVAIIEILPDYARVIDDGLYRAIDIYLKAHPALPDEECKKLCRYVDCQKLSQEASNHAAQNHRLPVQMTIQILYLEQLRLKNTMSGPSSGDGLFSQKIISSGVPSAPVSPRDNYASLRRENRELKLEISRLKMRLNDLEKEQGFMKQEMTEKANNGKTFLHSISRGFGRIGIFGRPTRRKPHKSGRKGRGLEGKAGRSKRHSVS